jgi:hypothetical protein
MWVLEFEPQKGKIKKDKEISEQVNTNNIDNLKEMDEYSEIQRKTCDHLHKIIKKIQHPFLINPAY